MDSVPEAKQNQRQNNHAKHDQSGRLSLRSVHFLLHLAAVRIVIEAEAQRQKWSIELVGQRRKWI
jgi:hypothetical protein